MRGSPPSIRSRLANALTAWSLAWSAAIGVAVAATAVHEVDELLDDSLESSAELLSAITLQADASALQAERVLPTADHGSQTFAWQVVAADGRLLLRSARAPAQPWLPAAAQGYSDVAQWRVYGLPLGSAGGRMLYAAQTREERSEARIEVALRAVLSALAIGLLGHLWLRRRLRRELQPVQTLSDRVAALGVERTHVPPQGVLGAAERLELQPVHDALQALMARLAERIANEQAFSAHAAHALRTPLAGIDAQLAVALRDAPPPLRERLQRVRDAATRLQGVVAALLGLFRSGAAPRPARVDLAALAARLPVSTLQVQAAPGAQVVGDPDLLAAALLNLLDNALRHGARQAWIDSPAPQVLRVHDDGPGVTPERRQALQAAIDAQAYEGHTGLGLMLADRVARAHGGRLRLRPSGQGFEVALELGAAGERPL